LSTLIRQVRAKPSFVFGDIVSHTQATDRDLNAMATEEFPAIFASTRTTLPRALKKVTCETSIAKSTVERRDWKGTRQENPAKTDILGLSTHFLAVQLD